MDVRKDLRHVFTGGLIYIKIYKMSPGHGDFFCNNSLILFLKRDINKKSLRSSLSTMESNVTFSVIRLVHHKDRYKNNLLSEIRISYIFTLSVDRRSFQDRR